MRKFLSIFCLLLAITFLGQDNFANKQNALVTIRGNIGIPRTVSSQMFRTCFAGVYETNLSVNIRIAGNFFVGMGYQNSYFQNNKFLKFKYFNASIPYNTRIAQHAGFIKLGTDKFFSPTGYMSYSLNAGLLQLNYTNVNADTNKLNRPYGFTKFISPYVQPEMSVNFIVDEKQTMSLSIILSYTTLFSHFDPKAPRFNQFEEINGKKNNYYMTWFNIGFGFTVLINKKSKGS
ncbi:MAG: hypothetical protein HYX39_13715 [Bacteroidetes bacterium]|nr:hypothetical protein [Bacteroidota bacterium]